MNGVHSHVKAQTTLTLADNTIGQRGTPHLPPKTLSQCIARTFQYHLNRLPLLCILEETRTLAYQRFSMLVFGAGADSLLSAMMVALDLDSQLVSSSSEFTFVTEKQFRFPDDGPDPDKRTQPGSGAPAPSKQPKAASFLGLPQELRDQIYDCIIDGNGDHPLPISAFFAGTTVSSLTRVLRGIGKEFLPRLLDRSYLLLRRLFSGQRAEEPSDVLA